ncbi:MAG: tRNA epoxyqueuosine(34) reductase QueG [candidate division Zixibacteria bacterium]|nr:tRNA epoxyqueuosine(34) reductase QueG [candidate division Zixibacteria bacterium]
MITSDDIKQLAARAGFDLCGICSAEPIPEAQAQFMAWLDKGYQAEMNWMAPEEQNLERRTDPSRLGIDAKSVIMLAVNYYQPNSDSVPVGYGQVSRYARGRDYHKVVENKIKKLLKLITTRFPDTTPEKFKWWVDYGPFMERAYAAKAGLGFLGKNGMLISRKFGSWLFLAEIVTTLELEPDDPNAVNHGRCAKCTKCIDACPTGAIVSDGVVDSSLCFSYWTVENPLHTSESVAAQNRHSLLGCDICQEVCPHNNKHRSILTAHDELMPDHGVGEFLSFEKILSMTTREEFLEMTAGTALTRPKLEGLQHTARIVKENRKT